MVFRSIILTTLPHRHGLSLDIYVLSRIFSILVTSKTTLTSLQQSPKINLNALSLGDNIHAILNYFVESSVKITKLLFTTKSWIFESYFYKYKDGEIRMGLLVRCKLLPYIF